MKRTETCIYESSTVDTSQYDYKHKTLIVTFKGGSQYLYEQIDEETYTKFSTADSQGKALNEYIKNDINVKVTKIN